MSGGKSQEASKISRVRLQPISDFRDLFLCPARVCAPRLDYRRPPGLATTANLHGRVGDRKTARPRWNPGPSCANYYARARPCGTWSPTTLLSQKRSVMSPHMALSFFRHAGVTTQNVALNPAGGFKWDGHSGARRGFRKSPGWPNPDPFGTFSIVPDQGTRRVLRPPGTPAGRPPWVLAMITGHIYLVCFCQTKS